MRLSDIDAYESADEPPAWDACDHPDRPDGCGCAEPVYTVERPPKYQIRQTWRFAEQSAALGSVGPYPITQRRRRRWWTRRP